MIASGSTKFTQGAQRKNLILFRIQIIFQSFYIFSEFLFAERGYSAESLGVVFPEFLRHLNISGFFQFCYLYTEVPGCSSRLFLYIGELSSFGADQKRNHCKPQLRMQYRIQILKACHDQPFFLRDNPG